VEVETITTPTAGTTTETSAPSGAREFFCGECGYGIVVRRDPPECPMCRGSSWRARPGFARWN
jgi:rubrerythrin